MEVIKHGNTYREKECPGCGALLSYCKVDIQHDDVVREVFGGDWYSSHKQYILCPECKKKIDLSWVIDGEEQIK